MNTISEHGHLTRCDYDHVILDLEVKRLVKTSIDHFTIPIIAGISLDHISQEEFNKMGYLGPKPEPLSAETKLTIYKRMEEFLTPKLLYIATGLVKGVMNESLNSLTDEEIEAKTKQLQEMVKVNTELDLSLFHSMVEDHLCMFKDLKATSMLKINPVTFHDPLCKMMSDYRDSGELFEKIGLKNILKEVDKG
ncbi:MAG: hypothetical protein K940chlam3_01302 [Chlamydiae bacterium]|nr:hypothetical protein [Chlamydiota bacterium]